MRELPQVLNVNIDLEVEYADSTNQIVFTLRAVQKPMTIPLSLASLTLINQTSNSFSATLFSLFGESFSLAEQFSNVRKLYEIENVQNKVVDGAESFPENQQALKSGISVEFRLIDIPCVLQPFLIHVCQECFVPIPWCREVCSPECFVHNRSWSTLRKYHIFCDTLLHHAFRSLSG